MSTSPFRLDGKVALVTGASRGLGFGMASALAAAGADVILHDILPAQDAATKLHSQFGVRTLSLLADMSKRDQADKMAQDAIAAWGSVDILVNNAGIIRRTPATEY